MLTIDAWNFVGSWVIGVGESESEYKFGVKGQKNIGFSNYSLLTIDAWNLVGSWVIGVRESESEYKFGVKGQKNIGFSNY